MDEKSKALDQIFLDIESLMKVEGKISVESTGLTLWVDIEYKRKFDELQDRTDRKFVQKLKELFYLAIDTASKG